MAFPRGKKRGHGQTDGTTTRGDHGSGADDLGARVDGGGIIEGGGAFPGNNCKIAFSSYDGHHQEINTINAGGGGRSRVTNNVDDIWRLFWRAGSGLTCHPTEE